MLSRNRRTLLPIWLLVALLSGLSGIAQSKSPSEEWQNLQSGDFGDQGNRHYRNPILAMDYSDPDVIRVGDDYFMISSTFESSPGVPVLRSRDLVHWDTVGAAFPDLSKLGPDFNWDRMANYKKGLYAPSIRYHAGRFYVFATSYGGEGFFVSTAQDPRGPWTVSQVRDKNGLPLRVSRWTDPCPFWDDDGHAYLLASRPGGGWFGFLFEMSPDGTQLLDAERDAMEERKEDLPWPKKGTIYSPFHGTEGNKIYKVNGVYYLIHIEFLDTGHGKGTYILRSRNLYGTLKDGSAGRPGNPGEYEVLKFSPGIPGQGGLVEAEDGRWFWIGQGPNDSPEGRTPNLIPVTWKDGWPVPGVRLPGLRGKMAWAQPSPLPSRGSGLPVHSDDFADKNLDPQWEWNHQPRADRWSLAERHGFLRLRAFPPVRPGFWGAGNTISIRSVRSELTTYAVRLDFSAFADGQRGGLVHFNGGLNYVSLGILKEATGAKLTFERDGTTTVIASMPPEVGTIWLRSEVPFDYKNQYSYSFDGVHFLKAGGEVPLKWGNWRGDMVGMYSYNPEEDAGVADFSAFRISAKHKPIAAR